MLRYILLNVMRDKFYHGMLSALLLVILIARFVAGTSLFERDEAIIVCTAWSVRFVLIFGMILCSCSHMRRILDSREIEIMLVRQSRTQLLLGYWGAFVSISIIMVIISSIFLRALTSANSVSLLCWAYGMLLEMILVATFSVLSSLVFSSVISAVMSSAMFYIMARITHSFAAENLLLKALSFALPRLDMNAQSSWLIYGIPDGIAPLMLQMIVFISLLLITALYDIKRCEY